MRRSKLIYETLPPLNGCKMKKVKPYKFIFEKESLWEMSNLIPKDTGLKYIVWVSTQIGKEKHGPRIKVEIDGNRVPVTIEDNPQWKSKKITIDAKSFNQIKEWILLNKKLLLDYWNSKGTMSSKYVVNKLVPVKNRNEK